jgi:hypothetical protein
MEHNKVPAVSRNCLDFFSFIRDDLLKFFQYFYEGKLDIWRVNNGIAIPLPKVIGTYKIQMFRPIFLVNVIFINFIEVLLCNLFFKGCFVFDNVLLLHETRHHVYRKKKSGFYSISISKRHTKN